TPASSRDAGAPKSFRIAGGPAAGHSGLPVPFPRGLSARSPCPGTEFLRHEPPRLRPLPGRDRPPLGRGGPEPAPGAAPAPPVAGPQARRIRDGRDGTRRVVGPPRRVVPGPG